MDERRKRQIRQWAKNLPYFFASCGAKDECECAKELVELLNDTPDVIRCRDCKKKGDVFECHLDSDLEEHGGHRTDAYDNWFCADGEPKEGR